ncbi:MAG: hypothetical protein QM765_53475 [Myxococcales bacterium]
MKSARQTEWFLSPDESAARPKPETGPVPAPAAPAAADPAWPKPFDFEPAVVESAQQVRPPAPDMDVLDDASLAFPNAHRRWLVRTAAIVGAASAVGLLVMIDMFVRTPAMATGVREPAPAPAPTPAPSPQPVAAIPAPAPSEPVAAAAPAESAAAEPEEAQPESAQAEAAAEDEAAAAPSEPEEPQQRRLPTLAPRTPAELKGKMAAHMRVGNQQLKDGLFRWARWNYHEAVTLAPKDPDAHFGLALAATELWQDRQARAEVDRALSLDPRHPLAHVLAGHLAQLHGDRARARQHYEQYLAIEPDGPFAPQVKAILSDPSATF